MVVQHNLAAMNANRMLGITTSAQSKSTEKLSSGFKINRAADDAAGLSISEKMRKQIRGLTQASDNAQDGISCVQTAEGALNEVHSMLQRMNELAVKASNGTLTDETDRKAVQDEIDSLITEIDRVSETTKFNDMYLLKGEPGTEQTKATYKYSMTDAAKDASKGTLAIKADAPGSAYAPGSADAITASTPATSGSAASMSFTDKGGGTNKLFASTDSWANNTEVTADNYETYFSVADDGTISAKGGAEFKVGANIGAGTNKTVDELKTDGWIAGTAKTDAADATTGTLDSYVELVDGELKYKEGKVLYKAPADADGEYGDQLEAQKIAESELGDYFESSAKPLLSSGTDNTAIIKETDDLSAYFEDGVYKGGIYREDSSDPAVITEIGAEQIGDYIKTDATISTVADALEFNLHVGSEWYDNNKISVKIEAMSSAGIGVDVLKTDGLMTEDKATAAIETISEAIQKVSNQRSALGAVQNRLEHTISNLDNIVENTTAAESLIRDVDMAEEMVEYSKNNILAQAGQSMLAQANQINQGVLSLLG